jgi:hypothetical protein
MDMRSPTTKQSEATTPKPIPAPNARAGPRCSNALGKPGTGLAAKIFRASSASLPAFLTVSAVCPGEAEDAAFCPAIGVPHLTHALALSVFSVPHFEQNIGILFLFGLTMFTA